MQLWPINTFNLRVETGPTRSVRLWPIKILRKRKGVTAKLPSDNAWAFVKSRSENPEWKLKEVKPRSLLGAEKPSLRFSKSWAPDCLRKTLFRYCWLAHGCTELCSPTHIFGRYYFFILKKNWRFLKLYQLYMVFCDLGFDYCLRPLIFVRWIMLGIDLQLLFRWLVV